MTMNSSFPQLPSNKKFGLFFSIIFFLIGCYFYVQGQSAYYYVIFSISLVLLLISFIFPKLLLPLNKLWMKLGLLIGQVVSPLVLGMIFFILFTPIAILSKLFGRDELRISLKRQNSHWKLRDDNSNKNIVFDKQF